ncbi:hypothetical protein ID866_9536 [Astraeus odoratus]|nr:hypothetical protein ID866_9536 [Astraeus odoratus]
MLKAQQNWPYHWQSKS